MKQNRFSEIFDLRNWLGVVENLGELKTVRGAHWNLEIGSLSEANYRQSKSPALLFDEIPDYPKGFRVLTGASNSPRRLGVALRMGSEFTNASLVKALRGKPIDWEAHAQELPPELLTDSPVMENVLLGNRVNLDLFPTPFWHKHDGGRFIETWALIVSRWLIASTSR
jgi:UbiD family decarboxylase